MQNKRTKKLLSKGISDNIKACFRESNENYYIEKAQEIYKYFSKQNDSKIPFIYKRTELIEELHQKVENDGFVFIESPLLKGKTTLLELYKNSLKNDVENKSIILFDILRQDDTLNVNEITSEKDLYVIWIKSILVYLTDRHLDKSKFGKKEKAFISSEKSIENAFLKAYDNHYQNYFEALLQIIKDFIDRHFDNISFYFVIRLEDFHTYISESAYTQFLEDISGLTDNPDESFKLLGKIKLIITTRTFPNVRPNRIVLYINNLSQDEVTKFLTESLRFNENCISTIDSIVFESTNGHPWFVNRFLYLFIILLIESNNKDESIEDIAKSIFKNEEYWKSNRIFNVSKKVHLKSEFLKKIEEKRKQYRNDTDFKNFIKSKFEDINLNSFQNNILIKEMGLINFEYDLELNGKLSIGNNLIKDFFIKGIITSINNE